MLNEITSSVNQQNTLYLSGNILLSDVNKHLFSHKNLDFDKAELKWCTVCNYLLAFCPNSRHVLYTLFVYTYRYSKYLIFLTFMQYITKVCTSLTFLVNIYYSCLQQMALFLLSVHGQIHNGSGKYSDPLRFFNNCYTASEKKLKYDIVLSNQTICSVTKPLLFN